MYKDLAIKTYSQIFIDNLHLLSQDLEGIKSLVIRNEGLLKDKVQKVLFIYELADLIKENKIKDALRQQHIYGTVIMSDYYQINSLYDWLVLKTDSDRGNKKVASNIWIKDHAFLEELVDLLLKENLIDTSQREEFIALFLQKDGNGNKVNWLGKITLLIYLIDSLRQENVIDGNLSINNFIELNFLNNGNLIQNIKQAKSNIKNNKQGKPQNSSFVDLFISQVK